MPVRQPLRQPRPQLVQRLEQVVDGEEEVELRWWQEEDVEQVRLVLPEERWRATVLEELCVLLLGPSLAEVVVVRPVGGVGAQHHSLLVLPHALDVGGLTVTAGVAA